MPEQWYIVVYRESGEPYSIGTSIADPMPDQFVAMPISESEAEGLSRGEMRWSAEDARVLDTSEH